MTPEERTEAIAADATDRLRFWLAGYRAAQEQAAEVAEDETGYLQSGGMDFGPNVPPRIAAAIRAMKPKETGDDT